MAQLSSDFRYFSCFPATADIVIDVDGLDNILPLWSSLTSTSMTMIFSTNQKWCDTHNDRDVDIMTTGVCRAAAVKIKKCWTLSEYGGESAPGPNILVKLSVDVGRQAILNPQVNLVPILTYKQNKTNPSNLRICTQLVILNTQGVHRPMLKLGHQKIIVANCSCK